MTVAETQNPTPRRPRITLIDTLRGVALIAMATYHFTWDLEFFGYVDPGTATQGFFRVYARSIASSFLFLAGVSLVLAHFPKIRWQPFWKRFAMVAGAALAISIATLVAFPGEWIYFGILHNIALSSLIGLAFLRLPPLLTGAIIALVVVAMIVDYSLVPGVLDSALFDARYLSWLGFAEVPPRSNDYVPLFPWIAALLAGVAVARIALSRNWPLRLAAVQTQENFLSKAGRHSLIVYLVHQPVLIALVYLFSLVHPAPPPDPRIGYVRSCEAGCTGRGNDAGLCQKFCGCTADKLIAQSLMTPLQSGAIAPQDGRVQSLAEQCSIEAQ
ncbi:DUF1624 domain-containing protein [Neorhizobium sp. BETTINA12A]|uniref:DUF1624 domain-containing protein n=1 Tax=Neorhizobium sp. BETTINA12A TaxID=2908924 RepID=UPI001FF64301|nr:DUF1624 domain-containing protein [Neorhizobium sp. BETTINA12A]MCJ9752392.1 DUF1624 domain-containing protein [Neorhizobium sp. BETTINA12A]